MRADSDSIKTALDYIKEIIKLKWEKEALEAYEKYEKEQTDKCQKL